MKPFERVTCTVAVAFVLVLGCGPAKMGSDDPGGAPEGSGGSGGGSPGAGPGGGRADAGGPGAAGGNPSSGQDAAAGSKPGDMPPPPEIAAPRVAISEIMYHPVLSNADDNNHEFIELHNPGTAAVAIAGWKLIGEVQFTFPNGASIAPGQFLVVAKNRAKLLELSKYNLGGLAAQVLGDYQGALDDGGGQIRLVDAGGAIIDAVAYNDSFPWPLAADAFGAGESWLQEEEWFSGMDPRRNFAAHRYLGHSLERVSYTVAATQVANWVPSPLDGASPGRPSSVSGAPPVVVESLIFGPESNPTMKVIKATDKVVVRVKLSPQSPLMNPQIEHYVEFDKGRKVAMPAVSRAPLVPGPMGLEAVLPPLPERTLVRFRITGERKAGGMREAIAPRPTDPIPYGHYAYYVSPQIAGKPYYEILISPENWGRLWTNISPNGLIMGCASSYSVSCKNCMENLSWNARVPTVFVFGGEAFDSRSHYNGSPEGRTFANDIPGWPASLPKPTAGPMRAFSWSVAFPKYKRFEGMSKLVLNRLNQSCPAFSTFVANFLYEDERGGGRVPAPKVRRWARLYVNGGAYNYIADIEPIAEDYLERFHGKGQPIGDVYKPESDSDLGPYGPGAGMKLLANPNCPTIPILTRYQKTFSLKTNDWRPHDEFMALVDGLNTARAGGAPKYKEYFAKNFDMDLLLKSYAIHQWGAPWDDWGKNYAIYKLPPQARRAGQGAWVIVPWDEDRMYGVANCTSSNCTRADISIYCGMPIPACNRWKSGVMDGLKTEYSAKLKELNETVLHPDNVKKYVDMALATYDASEARMMGAAPACDVTVEAANMKRFADKRYLSVKMQLGY